MMAVLLHVALPSVVCECVCPNNSTTVAEGFIFVRMVGTTLGLLRLERKHEELENYDGGGGGLVRTDCAQAKLRKLTCLAGGER